MIDFSKMFFILVGNSISGGIITTSILNYGNKKGYRQNVIRIVPVPSISERIVGRLAIECGRGRNTRENLRMFFFYLYL